MKEEVRQKVMERFSISEQAMRLLLESAEMMSFVPKDIIVHEGEINTNMYILSKGIWRAYTFKDGTEDTFWFAVESEIALPGMGIYFRLSFSLYHRSRYGKRGVLPIQTETRNPISILRAISKYRKKDSREFYALRSRLHG